MQACGDAHLLNFGMYAAPDRRLVFDVNDFDETLPAPFEWDVKRLAASFAVAARDKVEGQYRIRPAHPVIVPKARAKVMANRTLSWELVFSSRCTTARNGPHPLTRWVTTTTTAVKATNPASSPRSTDGFADDADSRDEPKEQRYRDGDRADDQETVEEIMMDRAKRCRQEPGGLHESSPPRRLRSAPRILSM